MATDVPKTPASLGLSLLIALVVGSIIGSGIFALPQNMAVGAGGRCHCDWMVNYRGGHVDAGLCLPDVGSSKA